MPACIMHEGQGQMSGCNQGFLWISHVNETLKVLIPEADNTVLLQVATASYLTHCVHSERENFVKSGYNYASANISGKSSAWLL